ncbi:MAG TPA: hypothetical protein VGE01_15175 [Fimbriimonas sp.]
MVFAAVFANDAPDGVASTPAVPVTARSARRLDWSTPARQIQPPDSAHPDSGLFTFFGEAIR